MIKFLITIFAIFAPMAAAAVLDMATAAAPPGIKLAEAIILVTILASYICIKLED